MWLSWYALAYTWSRIRDHSVIVNDSTNQTIYWYKINRPLTVDITSLACIYYYRHTAQLIYWVPIHRTLENMHRLICACNSRILTPTYPHNNYILCILSLSFHDYNEIKYKTLFFIMCENVLFLDPNPVDFNSIEESSSIGSPQENESITATVIKNSGASSLTREDMYLLESSASLSRLKKFLINN